MQYAVDILLGRLNVRAVNDISRNFAQYPEKAQTRVLALLHYAKYTFIDGWYFANCSYWINFTDGHPNFWWAVKCEKMQVRVFKRIIRIL